MIIIARMKLLKPKSIKIFSKEYTIQYVDTLGNVDPHSEDYLYGCIDFRSNTIRVFNNFPSPRDHYKTLAHEVLHGIVADLGIDFKNDSEERIIDNIALGIADILISNNLTK